MAFMPPLVRCAGITQRLAVPSEGLAAVATRSRASADFAAASASTAGRGGRGFSEVPEDAWALLCAGQLSMIMPLAAAATAAEARASLGGARSGAALAPREDALASCRFRCLGVSLRLDAEEASAEAGASAGSGAVEEDGQAPPGTTVIMQDMVRSGARGIEAVARSAGGIVLAAGGTALEVGPRRFLQNTATTAKKICTQATKIVRRSGQQVGRIAELSRRSFVRGASSASAASPGSGSGVRPTRPPPAPPPGG
eukprot:TRINITY_DN14234_c0_g1_i2.p2 TRINITY_DN14234_c0_g1~~TRINITY_DN14234_c0_g1_i2.p2  ORF type:complete len:255 (+),score=73.29 TRINITY_DN14234_c0_g1_i2:3065-3829(+)